MSAPPGSSSTSLPGRRQPGTGVAGYGGLLLPLLAAAPGLWLRFSGTTVPAPTAAAIFGVAVIGAAFLLSWGTELAEIDIGQGLALALLALIAVLPEYAVDTIFAWKAGQDPERYAPLALANMTGANRLLIGVGWSLVALVAVLALRRRGGRTDRRAREVRLEPVQLVEVAFLAIASVYALTLPLRSSINVIDTVILFCIFGAYLYRVYRIDGDDDDDEGEGEELFGPAARVAHLPPARRRVLTLAMLAVAAAVILAVAESFADSLVETGQQLEVSEFLLVQWVAPLASETPEFIAVLLLAWKLRSAAALGALISSKINQWTLLVGILPLVFAASAGSLDGLPMNAVQREEMLLTAAQSVFAVALVLRGRLTVRGAWLLLGLFLAQFLAAWLLPEPARGIERLALSGVYLVLTAALLVRRGRDLVAVLKVGVGRSDPVTALRDSEERDRSTSGSSASGPR